MGLKSVELNPISGTGPTVTIPASKLVHTKFFQVVRGSAGAIKVRLPAQASVIQVTMYGSVASDAGTSATVAINVTNNSGSISTATPDVKAAGASTAILQMTNLPNLEAIPANGDINIGATYAESGTPSTTGGPWVFRVDYV